MVYLVDAMIKQKNFKFTEANEARLDRTAKAIGRNQTDAVVIGLRVLERFVTEVQAGWRPAFIDPVSGRIREFDGEWGEASPIAVA